MRPTRVATELHQHLQQDGNERGAAKTDALLPEAIHIHTEMGRRMEGRPAGPEPWRALAVVPEVVAEAKLKKMLLGANDKAEVHHEGKDDSRRECRTFQKAREADRETKAAYVEWIPADGIWPVSLQSQVFVATDEQGRPDPDAGVEEKENPRAGVQQPGQKFAFGNSRRAERRCEGDRPKDDGTEQSPVLEAEVLPDKGTGSWTTGFSGINHPPTMKMPDESAMNMR